MRVLRTGPWRLRWPPPFPLMWEHQSGVQAPPLPLRRWGYIWVHEVCPSRPLTRSQPLTGSEPPEEGGSRGRGAHLQAGGPQVRKLRQGCASSRRPSPPRPSAPHASPLRPGPDPGPQHDGLLSLVSEGRRDQCEAPSDPKFPDCSGKVEVRPGAAAAGGGDQEGAPPWGPGPRLALGFRCWQGYPLARASLPRPLP